MAESQLSICNQALSRIGSAPIISIDGSSTEARECKRWYDTCLRAMLREMRPNFATARTTLTADATDPSFGWAKQYNLPADCLRVVQLNGFEEWQEPRKWEIEGRKLLTDETSAEIRYIKEVTDASLFDPLFSDALSCYLASKIAKRITGSSTIAGEQLEILRKLLAPITRRIDATENRRKQRNPPWIVSDLVKSRGSVSSGHDYGDFV